MSLDVCMETLATLQQRRTEMNNPEWFPEQLEEILVLMPDRSTEHDFRVCTALIKSIKISRLTGMQKSWLPSKDEVIAFLRIAEEFY